MSKYKDYIKPAFPVWGEAGDHIDNGMDLRDYFAAKALQGMLAGPNMIGHYPTDAQCAYKYADAMLQARKND